MQVLNIKTILSIILLFTVLNLKSQVAKTATHYYFKNSEGMYKSDSLSIKETIYFNNYDTLANKYYCLKFNNQLMHIVEILIYDTAVVGIMTEYYYRVEEEKLTTEEKKLFKGEKVKKYNYNICADTSFIGENYLKSIIQALEQANLDAVIEPEEDGYLICEGRQNFHFTEIINKKMKIFSVNVACLRQYNLNDNLIPIVFLLTQYTNRDMLENKQLPIGQMFKRDIHNSNVFLRLDKYRSTYKALNYN